MIQYQIGQAVQVEAQIAGRPDLDGVVTAVNPKTGNVQVEVEGNRLWYLPTEVKPALV